MDFLINFIGLGFSLAILIWGADKFVDSSSVLAKKFGVNELTIGLTVVALGTSAPEIFVGISSVLNQSESIAMGTVVGSNISNIAFLDEEKNKPTRIGFKFLEDGRKVRYSKLTGEVIDK